MLKILVPLLKSLGPNRTGLKPSWLFKGRPLRAFAGAACEDFTQTLAGELPLEQCE
jgi:hypothetical protein